MSDWIFRRGGRSSQRIDWLALDALFDTSLYQLWHGFRSRWAALTSFNQRFQLNGFLKLANELASEAATMGTLGLALLLGLAQPAFEIAAKGDFLAYNQYSVTFLDEEGNEIGKRGILRSDAVPLNEMPDHFIKALLATEDRRFYEHYGIDFYGTFRAVIEDLRSSDARQGGSSLTQQLAKNIFLTSEKSLERKIKEAFLAAWLESHLSKQEILKLYLERAYMGGGAFGAEAAAQFYFGKSIRNVSLAEGALLAGLFKAPTKYAPHINPAAARARADEVLSNMVEAGFMTEGQVHGARLHPAKVVDLHGPEAPEWFLDWAFEEVQRLMHGKADTVLTARVTVDVNMQRVAETTLETAIAQEGRQWHAKQAALVTMSPDGAVRALVGGIDYGENSFNRATQAKRQPGSSFKPYVYLAAVEDGLTPDSVVSDGPYACRNGHPVKNYSGGFSGRMPLSLALAKSVNTIAVRLSDRVTREKVSDVLRRLGVSKQIESCTMALGDGGVTLMEHTGAYAVFANGGRAVRPYGVLTIENSRGEVLYDRKRDEPEPQQIFAREHIEMLNVMMRRVVAEGTAKAADLDYAYVIGKTGTTSSHRDAWFMGATGSFATGIWFGNDDNRPMAGVTGGHGPAPIWKAYMSAAHTAPDLAQIPGLPLHPVQVAELELQAATQQSTAAGSRPGTGKEMSEETRDILRRIAEELRRARGEAMAPAAPGRKKAEAGGGTGGSLLASFGAASAGAQP